MNERRRHRGTRHVTAFTAARPVHFVLANRGWDLTWQAPTVPITGEK